MPCRRRCDTRLTHLKRALESTLEKSLKSTLKQILKSTLEIYYQWWNEHAGSVNQRQMTGLIQEREVIVESINIYSRTHSRVNVKIESETRNSKRIKARQGRRVKAKTYISMNFGLEDENNYTLQILFVHDIGTVLLIFLHRDTLPAKAALQ